MSTSGNRQNLNLDPNSHQIRIAAEAIVNASLNAQRNNGNNISHSIIHTPDTMISDIFIAGNRYNGRMSNVRRFFCLFITFDLFFTSLIWLMCTVITGSDVQKALLDQIIHYKISTSLFDIVMAAICRFTFLMLFYAILHFDHWFTVAFSTTLTSAFLLAKVFLYNWSQSNQPVFQVFLILVSFVLVWSELWFLDIKVIPQETLARDWFLGFSSNERTPLLGAKSSDIPASSESNTAGAGGNYYTPMDTPHLSEDEENEQESQRWEVQTKQLTSPMSFVLPQEQADEFRRFAPTLLKSSYDLLTSNEWKFESSTPEGDVISNMTLKRGKKIFKIMGLMDMAADKLIKDLYDNIETSPSWNKIINEIKRVSIIDDKTDIVYQLTHSLGKGAVGPRDYVILRHAGEYKSYNIITGMSVDSNLVPSKKNVVRAECGVTFFATMDLGIENSNKCQFIWVLDNNLKGWIPQKIVDITMHMGLIDLMTSLRKHVQALQD